MWNALKNIKKFAPKTELDKIIGTPRFQIEDRPMYYYGKGFAVYYSPKCFRIEGIQRVEYGVPGEYAVRLYHFSEVSALKRDFGLNVFEVDDVAPLEDDIIDSAISYRSTYSDIYTWVRQNPFDYQGRGETQNMVDGKMTFKNSFIRYGQYEFLFFGKSKRSRLTGFQYVFCE